MESGGEGGKSAMDFAPAGNGRLLVSLVVLAGLAWLAWFTMESGKARSLTLVLLGFFAFRIAIARVRSR